MFYHIALLELATNLPKGFDQMIEESAAKIRAECGELVHFSITPDESGRGNGFTHGMITIFKSEAGHDFYQTAKSHDEFKVKFLPYVKKSAFFDTTLV